MPLGYCAGMVGSLLLIFQDNTAVQSPRVKQSKKKEGLALRLTKAVKLCLFGLPWLSINTYQHVLPCCNMTLLFNE